MNKTIYSYYEQLTADLHSLYTADAFVKNQVLSLVADQEQVTLPQQVTYYIPEIDKLQTIPASKLKFIGYELIDEEHYFFFYTVCQEMVYDTLRATQRVLRATIAIAPIQGYKRPLVQLIEAIPVSCFEKEHQPLTSALRREAS